MFQGKLSGAGTQEGFSAAELHNKEAAAEAQVCSNSKKDPGPKMVCKQDLPNFTRGKTIS